MTDQFDQKICSDDDDKKCYEVAGATDTQWYRSGGSSHLADNEETVHDNCKKLDHKVFRKILIKTNVTDEDIPSHNITETADMARKKDTENVSFMS